MYMCYINFCILTCRELYETVDKLRDTELKEYTCGEPTQFGQYMDSVMGFNFDHKHH